MKKLYHYLFFIALLAALCNSCTEPFTQGKELYDTNCSRCHGVDGKGFEDLYPGILHSTYLTDANPSLSCVIAYGESYLVTRRNQERPHDVPMPENQQLSAVEVLNIINYLSWEFGNRKQRKLEEVMQKLDDCKP